MQHSPPQDDPANGSNPPSDPKKRTVKRSRQQDDNNDDSQTPGTLASAFRNVSACNRCRSRKNRCDQNLPACAACGKAGVDCVGYDPLTKRTVPRSFVYYLETRTAYLESLLRDHDVPFAAADQFTLAGIAANRTTPRPEEDTPNVIKDVEPRLGTPAETRRFRLDTKGGVVVNEKLNELVSNIGMSAEGTPGPWHLGSAGFGRVLYAAVNSTVNQLASERGGSRPGKSISTGATSMRDSFFGLQTKPTVKEAPLPDRELGMRLVELYFNHANPQIPILHRLEFTGLFDRVYSSKDYIPTSRELYLLNVVFAIGSAIIFDSGVKNEKPEEYHAAAIVHMEGFLGGSSPAGHTDMSGGSVEDLQAVLLLAGFALLRPVAPGLWYIVGVAVRLAVDLGLHYEDGIAIGEDDFHNGVGNTNGISIKQRRVGQKEQGRRQWIRDLRRRLWWCTYAFDRMVSSAVGRPFGITDQVITTEFPSLLDDAFISPLGVKPPLDGSNPPSYKHVSYHYFRLRVLQSEIMQVLQYQQAQKSQQSKRMAFDSILHTNLPSPFLSKFNSFRQWRLDIDRRLWDWKESCPTQIETGVQFSPMFFELNYWQAVILLYRQSLAVPFALAQEMAHVKDEVSSPSMTHVEERGDEEFVHLKIAEAAQQVLKIYRQLHRMHLVNYVYLSTHNIFQAGVSLLNALWNSTTVRSHFSLDDVDFTVLAATSVLGDLAVKCPPADICKHAFTRMAQATIQMCLSSTGFGGQVIRNVSTTTAAATREPLQDMQAPPMYLQRASSTALPTSNRSQMRVPQFDMNLEALFSADESNTRPFGHLQQIHTTPLSHNQMVNMSPQSTGTGTPQPQNTYIQPRIPPRSSIQQNSIRREPGNQQAYNEFGQPFIPTYPETNTFNNDMSFLDAFPISSGNGSVTSEVNNVDLDFLGMGASDFTTNHDWAEGAGMDLMDGFFFGGPAAGGMGGAGVGGGAGV